MGSRTTVEWMLDDLCAKLGFCLPREARVHLEKNPPLGIEAFTDAVFAAEGLDPNSDNHLRRKVRDLVATCLEGKVP
jgi:hypothetical protein